MDVACDRRADADRQSAGRRAGVPRADGRPHASQHADLARRVAINCFLLLLASLLVGAYVLEFFGLSIPVVQVAGGLVVCSLGWSLLTQPDEPAPSVQDATTGADARPIPACARSIR